MKRTLTVILFAAAAASCNQKNDVGKFTVSGELKNIPDQPVYLEELFFSEKPPIVLDSSTVTRGKFQVTGLASEEGMYRIRMGKNNTSYIFINDNKAISFNGDAVDPSLRAQAFSTPANNSLRKLMFYADSLQTSIKEQYQGVKKLQEANVAGSDSTYMAMAAALNKETEALTTFCFRYADTAKSPLVALFAVTMAPVEAAKFQLPLTNLAKRFPTNTVIADAMNYIRQQAIAQQQAQSQQQAAINTKVMPGSPAPELNMNDINDQPFSLSQLRGKYVLIDFWASWCGPCRQENPNVVAAFNQYKSKNFTVLGVSLDDNKHAWKEAVAQDGLTWQHISDLKKWRSAATELYGFNGIPFNVLIDPAGKIVASDLRGPALQQKLAEVLR